MSFYSVGKNEILGLIEKEKKLKKELEDMNSNNSGNNVSSFKAVILKNELKKIHNKLKVLTFGNNPEGGDTA